jgi:DNA-binding CsgD family transcriptional regulator
MERRLTAQEREVLRLHGAGLSPAEIARVLEIGEMTVIWIIANLVAERGAVRTDQLARTLAAPPARSPLPRIALSLMVVLVLTGAAVAALAATDTLHGPFFGRSARPSASLATFGAPARASTPPSSDPTIPPAAGANAPTPGASTAPPAAPTFAPVIPTRLPVVPSLVPVPTLPTVPPVSPTIVPLPSVTPTAMPTLPGPPPPLPTVPPLPTPHVLNTP